MSETYQKDSRNLEEIIVVDLDMKKEKINAGIEGARRVLIETEEEYNKIVKLYVREKISVSPERKEERTIAGVERAKEALLQADECYSTIVELYGSK